MIQIMRNLNNNNVKIVLNIYIYVSEYHVKNMSVDNF